GIGDAVVADVIDFERARAGIAQHHVGHAVAVEVAEAGDLPVQSDSSQAGGAGDVVVGDVVDLECARSAVAQQHVGGVAAVEAAEPGKLPNGSDRPERVARQDRVVADVVNLVLTSQAGGVRSAQDHVGGGARGRRRVRPDGCKE